MVNIVKGENYKAKEGAIKVGSEENFNVLCSMVNVLLNLNGVGNFSMSTLFKKAQKIKFENLGKVKMCITSFPPKAPGPDSSTGEFFQTLNERATATSTREAAGEHRHV